MITNNTRIYLKFLLFLWLTAILMRVGFLLWQWENLADFSWTELGKAFYIGIRFDGRIAAFMSLPLLICLFAPFISKSFHKVRPFLVAFYAIVFILYILIYIVDFAHYAYLQSRLNFAAIGLLEDTKESLGMIWQTYPVIKLLVLLGVIVSLLTFGSKMILNKWAYGTNTISSKITSGIATLLVVVILIYGQYGIIYYPLRWSEAFFSGHNQITALGLNPIQNLADTRPKNSYTDNTKQAKEAYPTAVEYLGVQNPNVDSMSYDRFSKATGGGAKPNIVIIVIESMSTHKSSLMFDELDTTRFLAQLAKESLYFPNYYASARTTARAMFSIITGIPDVNEYFKTSSRDPYTMDQHIVWNDFEGYDKLYMLGGNANWANIRGVLANNVSGLKIYEEGYWKSPRMDVWGISDENLLQESNTLLEEQKSPFISLIQLASFHGPFTVPKDIPDFDYTIPDEQYLKKYGFENRADEYLSMKYCDYALKKFFESAKKSSYYDNTIFIITGDHGMSQISPSVDKTYSSLLLHEFQVPLIIHAPKFFPQGKIMPQAGGHIDIFPTAAGLAGIKVHNTTMGRDLLDKSFGEGRFTFIRRWNRPPLLISNEYCYSNEYEQAGGGVLYKRTLKDSIHQDSTHWQLAGEKESHLSEKLRKINTDMLETATYMLYHNTKSRADKTKESLGD
ncbi:sulfatase-like hydrolase/transferase [Helicobacter sp. MIT 21-1697]|uniref:LTA synthase family protein n=1 Tax=Helicobacter sp. MIT 21-1697 TaxID=2993733 RepID=UPI00224A6BEF|nr:LTA synthase family protein [Helicobacter sp. MIT 21-1697]MCX2717054.1 sulfatase-like hydrolase/transferase [Helicobacter sp. MIT 21-1697]